MVQELILCFKMFGLGNVVQKVAQNNQTKVKVERMQVFLSLNFWSKTLVFDQKKLSWNDK